MFRLRNMKNGLFQIHSSSGQAYEGTPRSLFVAAMKLGISEPELVLAVKELEKTDDDYADFGSYGKFIRTKKNSK